MTAPAGASSGITSTGSGRAAGSGPQETISTISTISTKRSLAGHGSIDANALAQPGAHTGQYPTLLRADEACLAEGRVDWS